MMAVYDTYKAAVLANGSTKGVMFARNCLTGEEFFRSRVDFDYELQCPNLDGAFWLECNPADHLESLESFLTSGKRLASGDLITYLNGAVKSVENPKIMNTFADSQNKRYVVKAAAYDAYNEGYVIYSGRTLKGQAETTAERLNTKDLHIKNLSEREQKLASALRRDNERALYEINTLEQRIYNLHGRGNAWRFVAILGWGVFLGHMIGHWWGGLS